MGISEIWNKLTISERRLILVNNGFPDDSRIDEIVILDKDDFERWLLEYAFDFFPESYDEIKRTLGNEL